MFTLPETVAQRNPLLEEVILAYLKTRDAGATPDREELVARHPDLVQGDGIHPNARGVEVIARGLAPVVARVLAKQP